jgi:endoglucanase
LRASAALKKPKEPVILGSGDLDGDDISDPVTVRVKKSELSWFVELSATDTVKEFTFGSRFDVPLVADLDGDNRSDIGTFNRKTGEWRFLRASGELSEWVWGGPGDEPLVGDVDGDGLADFGVWKPAKGLFAIVLSSSGSVVTRILGKAGDAPFLADITGDGTAELAVVRLRARTLSFLVSDHQSETSATISARLPSVPGGRPIVGDFDGDGRVELGLWDVTKNRVTTRLSESGRTVVKRLRSRSEAPACLIR